MFKFAFLIKICHLKGNSIKEYIMYIIYYVYCVYVRLRIYMYYVYSMCISKQLRTSLLDFQVSVVHMCMYVCMCIHAYLQYIFMCMRDGYQSQPALHHHSMLRMCVHMLISINRTVLIGNVRSHLRPSTTS